MRLAHRGEQVFSFVFGHILWIVGEHCLGSSFARRLQHIESDTGYDTRRRAPDGALDGVSQTAVYDTYWGVLVGHQKPQPVLVTRRSAKSVRPSLNAGG